MGVVSSWGRHMHPCLQNSSQFIVFLMNILQVMGKSDQKVIEMVPLVDHTDAR